MGHRQRFVKLTNFPDTEFRLVETTEGNWTVHKSTMSEQQQKFDVKFTGFMQCGDDECKEQEECFHKAERENNESKYMCRINIVVIVRSETHNSVRYLACFLPSE
jgi:hypothetical protein